MNAFDNVSGIDVAIIDFPFWEIVIKSTIAIALAALACKLLGRQSAAVRHRVWVFGLAASLVVPMASLLLPQFTLHVLPSTLDASRVAATRDLRPPFLVSTAESSLPGSAGGVTANSITPRPELDTQSSTAKSADAPQTVRKSKALPSAFTGIAGIKQVLVLCWLLGTVLSATLFLIALARQSIWLSRLRRIDDDDWVNSVTTAARKLGLQRPIVALLTDEAYVPAVVGVLSPRLVVPCELANVEPGSAALHFASRTCPCKTTRRFGPVARTSRIARALV